jgi:hypothetical protein
MGEDRIPAPDDPLTAEWSPSQARVIVFVDEGSLVGDAPEGVEFVEVRRGSHIPRPIYL